MIVNNKLVMKWDYTYDKEGTWYDEDTGEEQYDLVERDEHALPHIRNKSLNIRSITVDDNIVKVEIYVDSKTYVVLNNGQSVCGCVYDNYMVAGDYVSQTLQLTFTIK